MRGGQSEQVGSVRSLTNFEAGNLLANSASEHSSNERAITLRDKTMAYAKQFSHIKSDNNLQAIKNELVGLTDYERATLINLCPSNEHMARTLIPSLANRSPDEIAEMINVIQRLSG